MASRTSAGILLYRFTPDGTLQVLAVHPGGPYFTNKDEGAWTVPKGEVEEGEEYRSTALREFAEEIGFRPEGELIDLGSVKQKGGKTVYAWAAEYVSGRDVSPESNTFTMEWPPRSGKRQEFPEIDRAEFFPLHEAETKINPAQVQLLRRLQDRLSDARSRE
jgi:predicted NUDIX family NTP pyrophosphohydrolase